MPQWQNSTRRDRLPSDWPRRRAIVLRDASHMCQWKYEDETLCLDPANQVDHIQAGDNHDFSNLQALCEYHHNRKSSGEGRAALAAKQRKIRNSFKRVEGHPGLL